MNSHTENNPDKPFQFDVVTVNTRGEVTHHEHKQAYYQITDLDNEIKLEMVYIPGGHFMMGSPEDEKGRDDNEGPQHSVTIAPFYMSKYPITQSQYQSVMGENPAKFQGQNHPVQRVSWSDAVMFSEKLSQKTGKIYQLPSEAQWEYACRAFTSTPFYFGDTITTALANYKGHSTYRAEPKGVYRKETTEIGIFPPNSFGLYDMHGNVWEWVADAWHDNYKGAPSDGCVWAEGKEPANAPVRGGALYRPASDCRCANRLKHSTDIRCQNIGFRIVL
ncbi:MAG: formylglycine-generating enzyme family protein [Candidatus Parabeggiatoa sp.]|nr:formylglycine-generating enzyme family protein [Candidatus Parabeggiatoa sp.]